MSGQRSRGHNNEECRNIAYYKKRFAYLLCFLLMWIFLIFLKNVRPILNNSMLTFTDNRNSASLIITSARIETTEYKRENELDNSTRSMKVNSMQSNITTFKLKNNKAKLNGIDLQNVNNNVTSIIVNAEDNYDDNTTTSIVFLTASSANHMKILKYDLLPSIEKYVLVGPTDFKNADIEVIHYNLDPIGTRWFYQEKYNDLSDLFPFLELRNFDYSAYPSFFNVEVNGGEYAWKATIIDEVANELYSSSTTSSGSVKYSQSFLYFLDAGQEITSSTLLKKDFAIAKKQGIYTPTSVGPLKKWTRQETSDYLGLDFDVYNNNSTRIGSGGIVLIDITNETIRNDVIKPWVHCSQHKECIAPKGSSRINHRQDQSALSVILNRVNIDISNGTESTRRGMYETGL